MKRVALLTAFIFCLCYPRILTAQEYLKPRFSIGTTAGYSMSEVIFLPKVQQKLMAGYEAGLILRADVNKNAGIWLEIDYSNSGWKEYNEEHPELKYERVLKWIRIPFMTHLMFGKSRWKICIDAGAHFGYLLGEISRSNYTENTEKGSQITRQHTMPVEKKLAWGLGGGPGVEYHGKRSIIGLRLSYIYGLGDLYRNKTKDYFSKSSEQIYAAKLYYLLTF